MAKIKEGDLFYISDVELEDGSTFQISKKRVGKLLFISKITRQMVAFITSVNSYEQKPSELSNIEFDKNIIYTGNKFLKMGAWEIIGNQTVTEEEKKLTIRLVGSSLKFLDQDLGVVPQSDWKLYNEQFILGLGLVYTKLNKYK